MFIGILWIMDSQSASIIQLTSLSKF